MDRRTFLKRLPLLAALAPVAGYKTAVQAMTEPETEEAYVMAFDRKPVPGQMLNASDFRKTKVVKVP